MQIIYPKNAYPLRETKFEKLDGFNIPYTEHQKLFGNVAVFGLDPFVFLHKNLKQPKQLIKLENVSLFLSQYLQICKLIQLSCGKKIQNS